MTAPLTDISIITPVYNESEMLKTFHARVSKVLSPLRFSYEIIFVDDGSTDNSFEILEAIKGEDASHVKLVKLARNFGHQLAISAGIFKASGKAVIVLDSDLQDPPQVILSFIEYWEQGFDIVYGVRKERKGETFFKKWTASLFYKLMRIATQIDIPENVGDFYLLDRKVIDVLNTMHERHRFIRGMIAWVGFRKKGVSYVREARYAGKSKFGLWKMVKFSFDAATSFSFLPLRIIAITGSFISALAFAGILATFYVRIFTNATITGWSSLMVAVLFIGGIQLLAIGIIGEYIGRIGDDVKARPLYIIEKVIS